MAKVINAKDFLNRGTVARAITLIDKQNSILEKQSDFDDALTKQLHSIRQNPTLVSPSWTLYRVIAEEVEFWQADEE
ncbi:FMN-binding protein [Brevibacillus laterosporus]|uniref:FMN-binding protein n=1 Tax=Brevibacillus laterosporus TaxID=1465 RepID=UPI000B9AA249|nr:FMN-binding protein [Brevibacillus laterosporus]MBG9789210.1 FMN-binding protein [Brevibacillus laterosporus]